MTNPLLDFSDLPLFDRIQPGHVGPAVDELMAKADAALETVTAPDFPASWTGIASTAWPTRPSCAPPTTPPCRA
jgi:oligopeptidase A